MKDYSLYVPDFREDMPEFTAERYPDPLVTRAYEHTAVYFGRLWGKYEKSSNFRLGWAYYVAHVLMVSMQASKKVGKNKVAGSVRGVDSTSIDDESIAFGSQIMLKLSPGDDELASTLYGVEYLRRRELVTIGFSCI